MVCPQPGHGIAKNTGPKVMARSIPRAGNAFAQPILTNPMNKITAPAKYTQTSSWSQEGREGLRKSA